MTQHGKGLPSADRRPKPHPNTDEESGQTVANQSEQHAEVPLELGALVFRMSVKCDRLVRGSCALAGRGSGVATTVHDILKLFRDNSETNRERGTRFE